MMIRDGKIELVESVRSQKKALIRMVELIEKDIAGRKPVRLGPFHALAFDDMVAMRKSHGSACSRLKLSAQRSARRLAVMSDLAPSRWQHRR